MIEGDALLAEAEALLDARRIDAALHRYKEAEAAGAALDRCAAGRWMAWMLRGELERAWIESDGIRKRLAPDPHRFWNGEDFEGKTVVLRCLHGFGDAVQMLRYAPQLAVRCAALIVELPPRLLDLAPCFDGVEHVITWGALAPAAAPAWDVQIEIMELPYIFRTTLPQLPIRSRYLELPQRARGRAAANVGERRAPRVGIVWAAGDWNRSRTLPAELVARLLLVTGCEFWSLQGGEEQTQWREIPGMVKHRDGAEFDEGILSLACMIEQMDLVITVDTLAAHLAGVLGKPAWVLLQFAADWRWMMDREDSPWYSSLKLYRQHAPGDWISAVEDVERDLRELLRCKNRFALAG